MGDTNKMFSVGERLIEYGRKYSNIRSQTMGHMVLGGVHNLTGDFPKQIECFQKAVNVSADPFYGNISKTFLSFGYILNDQISEAKDLLNKVEAYCNRNNEYWIGTPAKMMQGIVMIASGRMGKGLKTIEEALAMFVKGERLFYVTLTENVLGKKGT